MFDDEEDSSQRSQQYLANQRTFLSWIRTSIALIGLGFAIERFSIFLQQFEIIFNSRVAENVNVQSNPTLSDDYSALIGIGMVIVGVGLIVYALKNYLDTNKTISVSRTFIPKNTIIYTTSVIIMGLGIVMIIFLIMRLF